VPDRRDELPISGRTHLSNWVKTQKQTSFETYFDVTNDQHDPEPVPVRPYQTTSRRALNTATMQVPYPMEAVSSLLCVLSVFCYLASQ